MPSDVDKFLVLLLVDPERDLSAPKSDQQQSQKQYEPHPYAELFPLGDVSGPEWDAFRASVCDAQREAIYLYKGKILDGRRRYRACVEGGVEPRITVFGGTDGDALEFSIAMNLHRRHLTTNQKAMAGVAIKKAREECTRARMSAAGKIGGKSKAKGSTNLDDPSKGKRALDEAAEKVGVSATLISQAERVEDKGIPALKEQVKSDKVSISAAAEVARLPEEQQEEIVNEGPDAVRELAARARNAKNSPMNTLVKVWENATPEDQDKFLAYVKCERSKDSEEEEGKESVPDDTPVQTERPSDLHWAPKIEAISSAIDNSDLTDVELFWALGAAEYLHHYLKGETRLKRTLKDVPSATPGGKSVEAPSSTTEGKEKQKSRKGQSKAKAKAVQPKPAKQKTKKPRK